MNQPLLISIGVIFFLFILLTTILGPIGFFIMTFLTISFAAGYIYEGKNDKK